MVYCAFLNNALLATARGALCFKNAQKTIVYPIPNELFNLLSSLKFMYSQLLHANLSIKVRSYPLKLRARLFIASVTSDADNAI